MGSGVLYKVKVLRLVEDSIEVYALHEGEALEKAKGEPDVALVLEVIHGQ